MYLHPVLLLAGLATVLHYLAPGDNDGDGDGDDDGDDDGDVDEDDGEVLHQLAPGALL